MFDPIVIKMYERILRRRLHELEISGQMYVVFPSGTKMYLHIPVLNFPYDLMNETDKQGVIRKYAK